MSDGRMNHPAEGHGASWRCSDRTEGFTLGDLEMAGEICTLPAGHTGWHRSDAGNQWRLAQTTDTTEGRAS